jgi:hypothetical protein
MSLFHPALLILTLFIVLRLRSMKIKLPFKLHHKQLHHSSYGVGVGRTAEPRQTLKAVVVILLVILHAYRSVIAISQFHPVLLIFIILFIMLHTRSMLNFQIKQYHYSHGASVGSKGKNTDPRLTLKTTVVMLVCGEKGEMHLMVIIHQRLILSGDVELNPGPGLGGEQLLLSIMLLYTACNVQTYVGGHLFNIHSMHGHRKFYNRAGMNNDIVMFNLYYLQYWIWGM